MIVTLDFLKKNSACQDGIDYFIKVFKQKAELKTIINYAIKSKNNKLLQYVNWLIVRKMNYKQQIKYAIFAAEQVIDLYEKKYPKDIRPRQAIKAAKKVLKNNNQKNKNAADVAADAAYAAYAAYAAAYAAYAAAYAADVAADAAADAADAAADAAYAAAYAAYAADVAAYAAYAAADAAYAAAYATMKIKILKYGLILIIKNNKTRE